MLTNKDCIEAKPRATLYRLHDQRGLYLEVKASGVKVWRYRFTLHGKASMYTLGHYPQTPLEEARRSLEVARREVANGSNPAHTRKAEKIRHVVAAARTFEALAQAWIASREWSAVTKLRKLAILQRWVFPIIGKQPVSTITADDIQFVVDNIIKHGAQSTALPIHRSIKAIIAFSMQPGPCVLIEHCSSQPRPTPAIPSKTLTLSEYEAWQEKLKIECFVALQKVSPWDTQVVLHAQWRDFSTDYTTWKVPAQLASEDRQQPLQVPRHAQVKLEALATAFAHQRYLFPNRHRNGPMSLRALRQGLKVLA